MFIHIDRIGADPQRLRDLPAGHLLQRQHRKRLINQRRHRRAQILQRLIQNMRPPLLLPTVFAFGKEFFHGQRNLLHGNFAVVPLPHQITRSVLNDAFEVIAEPPAGFVVMKRPGGFEKGEHDQLNQFLLFRAVQTQIPAAQQDERPVRIIEFRPADFIPAPERGKQTAVGGERHEYLRIFPQ